jgi:HlyD family secretion protein
MPRWWAGVALLAVIIGGVLAWAFHTTTEVQVSTATVTVGPIARRIFATGTLQPVTTVEVGTQVSGIVQAVLADYNSTVRQGQVVAKLDPSLYDAQLRAAQAALAQTRADLLGVDAAVADAQIITRAEALSAAALIPASDLDAARIALDEARADQAAGEAAVGQAQAAVDQAKAVLNQAEINIAHTIIRSPIDGIVIERSVDVGQTLAASVQAPVLFRIAADLTRMQVQVDVDESDVGGLTVGDSVAFDVEAYPGQTFRGTLSQVRLQPIAEQTVTATTIPTSTMAPTTSTIASVVSYTAIVDVTNPDERLRPGMTAEVALHGSRRDHVVRIPNGALAFRPSPEVLQALGEVEPPLQDSSAREGDGSPRHVWEYDGKQFFSIPVRAGLADDGWTELLRGSVRPGDALVTGAVLERCSRM